MGETQGFVKVLVDADTDRFLGRQRCWASHGDEVIGLFALAMSAGLTTERVPARGAAAPDGGRADAVLIFFVWISVSASNSSSIVPKPPGNTTNAVEYFTRSTLRTKK
jgi:hypothetical protein